MIRRLACALMLFAPGLALAQPAPPALPRGPIRLVVGFPPGGGIDLLTRVLAAGLAPRLGVPVVVENRGGAGGNLAAEIVARAPPDGSVMGAVPAGPLVINRHIYRSMPFDPLVDLTPISRFAAIPVILMGAPNWPVTNIAELRAALRAGPVACGTPGAGTTQHLATALLLRAIEAPCDIVHYRGTGPALPDLLTGTIQAYTDTVVTGLPPTRDGRARAIAIFSATRSPLAPELPTVAETIPGFSAETWLALMGPRGLPDALAAWFEQAAIAVARDPAVIAQIRALGAEAVGSDRAALATAIRDQDAMWGPIARAAGVNAD